MLEVPIYTLVLIASDGHLSVATTNGTLHQNTKTFRDAVV